MLVSGTEDARVSHKQGTRAGDTSAACLIEAKVPAGQKLRSHVYSTSNSMVRTFEVLPAESIAFNSAR